MAFDTKKFMLPIRLGTLNAAGAQELFVYTLTRTGRVEPLNYRTVRLPSDVDLPVHVKDEFAAFYRDMFRTQVERERGEAVFLEYAWDMGWCDPCAADPLTPRRAAPTRRHSGPTAPLARARASCQRRLARATPS